MLWKIIQFSLFHCPSNISIWKYVSPLESNFPFSARKSMVLPFHPQASIRCRCVSYMYQSHLRRTKASHRWLCSATALVRCREDDSKKSEMCWYKRKFPDYFFCQGRRAFWIRVNSSAPPLSIWRKTSGIRRTSLPRFVTVVDREGWCFWNQKVAYRTTPPWKITAMKPENAQ